MNLLDTSKKSSDAILAELQAFKENDIPWEGGKTFALTYKPPQDTYDLIKKAYSCFLTENALDPTSFPSILRLETEVIQTALELMNAPVGAVGTFTFGGTESIFLAVKAARDYAREKKRIKKPNLVLPVTAHAAFHKACHYLGVEVRVSTVDDRTFRASPISIEKQIDKNTILIVASAVSYAHGVIDPIEDIAEIAIRKGKLFHVDCCVGGMYLPFAKSLGHNIPDFDFKIDGVTSISLDFHKYGYTAKGASCILMKEAWLREYQIYSCSNWTGYTIINPTVMSSKSAGSLAACWATLKHLGRKGYVDLTASCQSATQKLINAIGEMPDIEVLGNPHMNMFCFASVRDELSVFHLAEVLKEMGWFTQIQLENDISPANIHISVNPLNIPNIEEFIEDLKAGIQNSIGKTKRSMLSNPLVSLLLKNVSPKTIVKLQGYLGFKDGDLPDDLEEINQILNTLTPTKRDALLKIFMNQLLASKDD